MDHIFQNILTDEKLDNPPPPPPPLTDEVFAMARRRRVRNFTVLLIKRRGHRRGLFFFVNQAVMRTATMRQVTEESVSGSNRVLALVCLLARG